ncbi:hypothetical protein RI129_002248 [Pyrocoelia pectoralis]|uniref:ornithine decarboxylase n=1 Tax=Pyrocoelia pectoralis TaxID=417401 RepID=A0AAN7VLI2_9COLE
MIKIDKTDSVHNLFNKMSSESEYIEVYENNTTVDRIIVEKVTRSVHTDPFFICNISEIFRKGSMWGNLLPRIKPFYAVKANSNVLVVKILADLGVNFDCASKYEIDLVLSLGVQPSRIIYAHSIKSPGYIQHAAELGIKLMTFDNEEELRKMKKIYPDVHAVIRIRCNSKNAVVKFGSKFGCDVENEADDLVKLARDLHVNLVGVSFHIGIGCKDLPSYYNAIKSARLVFNIAKRYGYNLHMLDIGGGFPGADDSIFKEITMTVNNALDTYFSDHSIQIIGEPGTFLVDSAFTLACSVTSRKFRSDQWIYYINDGIYGSFNKGTSFEHQFTMYPLKMYSNAELHNSTVFGVTCSSIDKLIDGIKLPVLDIDDWLIFKNMGAYCLSFRTSMNGFFTPYTFYVINENGLTHHGFSECNHRFSKISLEQIEDGIYNFYEQFGVTFCVDRSFGLNSEEQESVRDTC